MKKYFLLLFLILNIGIFAEWVEVDREIQEGMTSIKLSENEVLTPEILEKLTCPFSDVSETHWAYNDILLAACEY